MASQGAWWLKVVGTIGHIRRAPALDLNYSASDLASPEIAHDPDGSELSFLLTPITDDTFGVLDDARRDGIPVRLCSLKQPLKLVVTDLQRVADGARVTGRIV